MSDWFQTPDAYTEPVRARHPFLSAPPALHFESASDTAAEEKTPAPPTAPSVMIVDDNATTLDTFARYFRLEGIAVTVVTSGRSAVANALQRAFDVLVLDLYLQDMNGVAVLAELRAAGFRSPVVMISGFGTAEEIAAAMKLGAADFLSKPVNCEDLVRMVRALSESSQTADHARSSWARGGRLRDALADVRSVLHRIRWEGGPDGAADGTELDKIRAQVVAVLARAATRADLTIGQFLGCAEALRRVVSLTDWAKCSELTDAALQALDPVQEPDSGACHPKVKAALAALGATDGSGLALSQWALGRRLAVSRAHLGRLLQQKTARGFREWRRLFRIKRAAQELVDITEHVRQVAFRVGYSQHAQFDREFEQVIGLSPTSFRHALAVT